MAVVLKATWTATEGSEAIVLDALEKLSPRSREEPGCRAYRPTRSVDEPRVFLVYEEYDDEAALEAHSASEHFRRYVLEQGIPLLESRERMFFRTLD